MQNFNIFNANERNSGAESLISDILKTIGYNAVFHNKLESISLLQNGEVIPMKIDMIYFDGGEDVNPSLYGESKHPKTYFNEDRDYIEHRNFNMLKKYFPNVPSFGICRGAQMLTTLSGGSLIQHVENHGTCHYIEIPSFDLTVKVTSTHHQMMYPYNLKSSNYKIIGYSKDILSPVHEVGSYKGIKNIKYPEDFKECEIVYYTNTNSLCIQGHPEYASATKQFKDLTKELLLRLIYNKL